MNQDTRGRATADEISTWRPPPPRTAPPVRTRRYAFACAEVVFSSAIDNRRD